MPSRRVPGRAALAATTTLAACLCAASALAQTGRVGGVIKDETGEPIKGATIRADNPAASPSSFTAVTDDKGRFSMIGLRSGQWSFTIEATGFLPFATRMPVSTIGAPNPPLMINLKHGGTPTTGALAGINAKDLQLELGVADQLFNAQKWDESIAAYKGILAKAPALTVINLQVAAAYRGKKDYDSALAAYGELLKVDPSNKKAKAGSEITSLFKQGLEALNKGDKDTAMKMMEQVIAVDPESPEAAQAKTVIDQLKK